MDRKGTADTNEFDVKMTNIKFHCLTVLTRSMSFSLSMSFFTVGMVKNGEIVSMFFFDELQIFFHPSYLSPCNFPSTLCLPRAAIRIAGMQAGSAQTASLRPAMGRLQSDCSLSTQKTYHKKGFLMHLLLFYPPNECLEFGIMGAMVEIINV